MCLTIPKKVISKEGDFFVLENPQGDRQKAQSIVDLKVGDWCFTQGGVIIQKTNEKEAEEIFKIIDNTKGE